MHTDRCKSPLLLICLISIPLSLSLSLCPCSSSSEHASQWEWISEHRQRSRRGCGGGNLLHPASVSTWPHLRPQSSSSARRPATLASSILHLRCISASVLAAVHVFPPAATLNWPLWAGLLSLWAHREVQRNIETVEYLKSASSVNDLPHFSVSLRSKWTFCKISFIIFAIAHVS